MKGPAAGEPSQREYLQEVKATLGLTWDALALGAGISPRALKNYRMPEHSRDHRRMPSLARRAIDQLVSVHAKKIRKKAA